MSRVGYVYIYPATNQMPCKSCGKDTQQTFYKIGFTRQDPYARWKDFDTHCPLDVGDIMASSLANEAFENFLHNQFSHLCIKGEWHTDDLKEELPIIREYMQSPLDYQAKKPTKKQRKRIITPIAPIDFSDL